MRVFHEIFERGIDLTVLQLLYQNALKYAFPKDGKGNITISLSQSTLNTLTQQLDGQFEEYENGASTLFQFETKPAA